MRTSWPSAVRTSIRRPTEKLPARLRIGTETRGCLTPVEIRATAGTPPPSAPTAQ
jgi:hypothetical protein